HASAHTRSLPPSPTRRSSDLLRLASPLPADRIEAALTAVGDVEGVAVGGDEALGSGARVEPGAAGVLEGGGRSRHIRVALRRLRSEEHTSELQSRFDLVCRLL